MPVVASPRNPLRTYQFRVAVIAGNAQPSGALHPYVAGVKSVSGLRSQVSAWEAWEGGNNLHRYANPNKVTWDPIVLEQGLALDDTFERWAAAVLNFAATGTVTKNEPVKRQVTIDVYDENSHPEGPPALARAPGQRSSGEPPLGRLPVSSNPGSISRRPDRDFAVTC